MPRLGHTLLYLGQLVRHHHMKVPVMSALAVSVLPRSWLRLWADSSFVFFVYAAHFLRRCSEMFRPVIAPKTGRNIF